MATQSPCPFLWLRLLMPLFFLLAKNEAMILYSSRLIHRFSDEMKPHLKVSKEASEGWPWPERNTMRYYEMLLSSDFERHKRKLGAHYQLLYPSRGSKTFFFGDDFGWLHYSWIELGTPSVSFLVALDTGSDLLWVPCDCIQCASLAASSYSSLDRDLNEYSPTNSNSSKHLSCSHPFCESSSHCKSSKQPCPYTVNYLSENTSSSGLLIEDILHLASVGSDAAKTFVQAPVVIGCGMKQTGGYLDGVAPDGLMGLGLGETSVPSLLDKAGLVPNSFSMCFDKDQSGRIFFGDQGAASQQSTPLLPLDGIYSTYIVEVDACCIQESCIAMTNFEALVDSGTSFTFLPAQVYKTIVQEFDRHVNASRSNFERSPWEYCYQSRTQELPKLPSLIFAFQKNNRFVVKNSVTKIYDSQGIIGFCLALQPTDGDIGIIGQNYMMGYRLVFDRTDMRLAWSHSDCRDLSVSNGTLLAPPPSGILPTPLPTEQQKNPGKPAVAPAVAGRAPSKPSAASTPIISSRFCTLLLLPLSFLLSEVISGFPVR